MIGDLTDVVSDKAPKYAKQLKEMGHNLSIATNLSVDSLTNLEWPDRISSDFHVSLGHNGLVLNRWDVISIKIKALTIN